MTMVGGAWGTAEGKELIHEYEGMPNILTGVKKIASLLFRLAAPGSKRNNSIHKIKKRYFTTCYNDTTYYF